MLNVGFSAAREFRVSAKESVPAPSNMVPVMPALVSKLNVAAMLEVTVKCGGRSKLSRAIFRSRTC